MWMMPRTLGAINTSDESVLAALPGPLAVLSLYAFVDSISVVIQVHARDGYPWGAVGCCYRLAMQIDIDSIVFATFDRACIMILAGSATRGG